MLAHVGAMLAHLGAMLAHLGLCWPILGLCWPILGLCWPMLRPMLAHLEAYVGPCGPILNHKIRKIGKNGKSTKHRKTGQFLAVRGGRRQGVRPLSPTERRELPYGKDTARGPLAGFKRLRATAGQGPNYVGPSCGYMLAYVGVCWPILRATRAHLVARLAYVCLMLAHVEPKDPKNGTAKKRCKTQDI